MIPQIADWDDAYANITHIPGGAGFPDAWAASAAAFRAGHPPQPDGDAELYLPPAPAAGLAVFIHGGYWMKFGPSWFSHLAAGPLARGWAVLIPSYPLAPAAGLREMRDAVAAQITAAATRIAGPISICGHSAGGHLAARLVCEDSPLPQGVVARITRCLPISGLFDLWPLQRTQMRVALGLDDDTARKESPLFHQPAPHLDLQVWVGAGERPEFVRQSRLIHTAWAGIPRESGLTVEPGRHHLDVIDGLAFPDHPLTQALLAPACP